MKHTDIFDVMNDASFVNATATVCGWARTSRDSKTMAFVELNDGTTLKHLQIVIDKEKIANPAPFLKLGSALRVVGQIVPSRNGSVEMNAESIELIGECPSEYPLQKKRHTLEYLRTIPHLRLRANTFNAVFRVRSVLSAAIHEFFQGRRYVYVHTPIVTASDCEGAGEMFRVTTRPWNAEAKSEEEYYADDFFGQKAGLSVSGQLEGEVAAMAFGKIYTFGPSFRAECSNTPRHVAEFWHVEPEIAFAELPDVIEVVESSIKYVVKAVLERCPNELAFFDKNFENGLIDKLNRLVSEDFGVVTYTEAIEILKKADVKFEFPVEWGGDLATEHEKYLAEVAFGKPVFVTDYPKEIKSFYMKQNPDGKTVAATDLLAPGVGEIIGGSEREADLGKLLQAMQDRGMSTAEYENYIDLRRFGSTPHGGFGLGLERLVMYVTGIENIRDVILYPRVVNKVY
ncbi:MAG: asparagine--tRNA ligase [Thermoguttaceae bacterium]|nr:asparagine--tRNA ligase [Thermoguttaceae bacterium]MBP3556761.1 asparagine--tRNA ligase [Thermoguttaceae bacterium]MBQ7029321.1 asparagine--tRNA ligase [Thermoguttaceae bacterium]MBQ8286255.1 asparagine--tRNA ligase [Thermoguttaceae bacterium]MBQ9800275.1 asparagine--tRNA ligase [Thermoguttaceae bacterium]